MRTNAYVVALTLLLASMVGCGQSLPYEAVCAIEMPNGVWGSGTLVGVTDEHALILTCRHVASNGSTAILHWSDGQTTTGYVGEVLPASPPYEMRNDLALIICERPSGVSPVRLAKFNPANAPFVSIGVRRSAIYISHAKTGEAVAKAPGMLKFSAPAVPGMSGGGTFDCNGNLVGVCVGGDFDSDKSGNLVRIGDWSVSADGEALHELVSKYQ